jgi:hypothetical protein
MKFDFNKLKEMNELDFDQVAIWPFEIKTVLALFVVIVAGVGGYYALVKSKVRLNSAIKPSIASQSIWKPMKNNSPEFSKTFHRC